MKTSNLSRTLGLVLLLAPAIAMAQSILMSNGSILSRFGLESDTSGVLKFMGWLLVAIWLNGGFLVAIARWRGQPGVSRMVLRDTVICSLWLVSIIGSWIAAYFLLRSVYRALTYEDVASGLR